MSKLQNKILDPKPISKMTPKGKKDSKGFQKQKIKKVRKQKGYIMKVITKEILTEGQNGCAIPSKAC